MSREVGVGEGYVLALDIFEWENYVVPVNCSCMLLHLHFA